jgi:hypothetical protein
MKFILKKGIILIFNLILIVNCIDLNALIIKRNKRKAGADAVLRQRNESMRSGGKNFIKSIGGRSISHLNSGSSAFARSYRQAFGGKVLSRRKRSVGKVVPKKKGKGKVKGSDNQKIEQ